MCHMRVIGSKQAKKLEVMYNFASLKLQLFDIALF